MLPDLPKLKNKIFEFQKEFMHYSIKQSAGVFTESKRVHLFEGHKHGIERSSGDKEEHNFTPIEGMLTLKPNEDDIDSTFDKLYDAAVQMAQKFQKRAFQRLDESLTDAGQSVDATAMAAADTIFEMLEKVEFPLGKDGKLDMSGYKFVCGPETYNRAREAFREINLDTEKTNRLENLFKRKEEEARAREANRKLVG